MAVIHTTACEELIRQIESFADPGDLGPDEWSSTASSIADASDFLRSLYRQEDEAWPVPDAGPSYDEGVDIRWERAGRGMSVHLPGDPQHPRWLTRIIGGLQHRIVGVAELSSVLELMDWVCDRTSLRED